MGTIKGILYDAKVYAKRFYYSVLRNRYKDEMKYSKIELGLDIFDLVTFLEHDTEYLSEVKRKMEEFYNEGYIGTIEL